jgi:hypothetical protein
MRYKFPLGLLAIASGFMLSTHSAMADPNEKLQWLTYKGGDGPGKGKHIVLISADQEYRSEQAIPMLARILSTHHGFDTTVLFSVNAEGLVDPTLPTPDRKEDASFRKHNIPGLDQLAKADALILFMRLISLPLDQEKHLVNYFDSGKPIIALRTSNHGFAANLDYKINDQQVSLSQIFGRQTQPVAISFLK